MFSTSSLGATATDRDLPDLGRREGGAEEEKSAGYPERSLSLLRDMESIRDQADAKETAAAANYEGGGEEDEDDWDGDVGKNIQQEG